MRTELEERGFNTLAVDLPASDPNATYDDYAEAAAEAFRPAIENGGRIDIGAHSMGSQTVPKLVKKLGVGAVRNVIHISGSIGEGGTGVSPETLPTTIVPWVPRQRNTEDYRRATLRLDSGLTVLNPSEIRKLLFGDCDPNDFIRALELMRLQAKPPNEPSLDDYRLPGVNQIYILGEDDPIRDKGYVLDKIVGELGMKLVMMKGGHSPAIARPGELADIIASEVRTSLTLEDTGVLRMPTTFGPGSPR